MILGAVLAGGQSRRFGSDKAVAPWNGTPLIDHVIAGLQPFVTTIVICGRDKAGRTSIADRPAAGLGPLGGLNAALHHAGMLGYDRVIAVPCDAPLLESSLLSALAAVQEDAYLADMPVIGSWRSAHAATLDRYVGTADSLSVRKWAATVGAIPLYLPSPVNINRPEDMRMLDRR